MNKFVLIGIIVLIVSIGTIHISNMKVTSSQGQSKTTTTTTPVKVAAGGGNATAPWTIFIPQTVEVKAGQSVTWHNPTEVAEPHTVTFVLNNNTMTGVVSPLIVLNTTKFMALPPGSNNEPVLLSDEKGSNSGMNTIIALNARSFNPVAIDSQGNVKSMNPNANYSITGTEKYVNSGWFVPNGLEQQYPGSGNTFTVRFEKAGTYDYLCIIHPWMTGRVVVS
jgi:plastocyanin